MTTLFGEESKSIRALNWKQPYCYLMMHGKVETRTWYTGYRGLVLMCASKSPYSNKQLLEIAGDKQWSRIVQMTDYVDLISGQAQSVGFLYGCRPMTIEDEDKCFVKYRPGLYCHLYTDVKAIKPFPHKGSQGWKKMPSGLYENLQFL